MSKLKLGIKHQIDEIFEQASKAKDFDPKNKDQLYKTGKALESKITGLVEKIDKGNNKTFKYVTWTWYEYILQRIDPEHFWWVSYADERRVETTMIWLGKEYKGSYGVSKLAKNKKGEEFKTTSEGVIDDGMRCYAKLASRVTYLFYHFWLEGSNIYENNFGGYN